MAKSLFITEKPSVAQEFAKILGVQGPRRGGFIESDKAIITWCVGHLVTMSYPEAYDEKLKRWSLNTLPFLPREYKYEVVPAVKNQFDVVKEQLLRPEIDTIYVCTDSGREGEYIYRLIDQLVGVVGKAKKRVWIDSQTEDEIKRGIKEAKPLDEYNPLAESAYLRAKEDYMAGINFSRLLTLIYGQIVGNASRSDKSVIAVGRVMSCVLGMVVDREREIRNFVKTQFFKVAGVFAINQELSYEGEWKAVEGSKYLNSDLLYNDNGFRAVEDAEKLISELKGRDQAIKAIVEQVSKKQQKENAPLLYNLAELQNECSKRYKLSPDQTLSVVQSLYEKKLLTYPRTDARVLSNAVAKEIKKNINGLTVFKGDISIQEAAKKVLNNGWHNGLAKTKYVNDEKITDHYAIVPTGQGLENFNGLKDLEKSIYSLVVRRFLAIFYPPAVFNKISITTIIGQERFFTSEKVCISQGYMEILKPEKEENEDLKQENAEMLSKLKKGQEVSVKDFRIKEGETSPPNRYTSGSIILAMENAGKLIEEEELREQIKGSGIGTSATRAEIIKKLERIEYIGCNSKTQVLTPTIKGEMIYEVIRDSIPDLLNPSLTASWEKGLEMVAKSEIKPEDYLQKLEKYVRDKVQGVLRRKNQADVKKLFECVPKIDDTPEEKKVTRKKREAAKGLISCPICNKGEIVKINEEYSCSARQEGCKFLVGKVFGKEITEAQIKKLVQKGKTDIIKGFKSNKGIEFDARLILNNGKMELSIEKN